MLALMYTVVGLLLERWPGAQIILPGESVIHGHEFTMVLPCKCFLCIYVSSSLSWGVILCTVQNNESEITGYQSEKEYEIFCNIVAHRCVICLDSIIQPENLLAEWSLVELIEDIERLTSRCEAHRENSSCVLPV